MQDLIGFLVILGIGSAVLGVIGWRLTLFFNRKINRTENKQQYTPIKNSGDSGENVDHAHEKCHQNEMADHIAGQEIKCASPYPKVTDKLGKSIQIILFVCAVCSGIAAAIGLFGGLLDGTMWVWLGWGLSGVVVSLVAYWFVRTLSNIYLVLAEIRDNTKKQ